MWWCASARPGRAEHDRCKRLPMLRLDAHGRVDQLARQDRGDLRRHGVGRVGQVRPDEDFKVPVRAAPVIPALADRPAPTARACKADRHPHPLGRGAPNASNSGAMPAATPFSRLSRQPAFPVIVDRLIFSFTSPQGDGLCHRPCRRGEQPGARGRRESVWVVRAQAQPSHGPGRLPFRGRGGGAPFSLLDGDHRRRRRRPHADLKPARASDRRRAGTRRQGRLGRSAAEIERGPVGDAPIALR